MESWSYVSEEEKGYVSNDTQALSPPKNSFLGWELKTPSCFSNDMLALSQQNIENQGSQEMGFSEMLGKLDGSSRHGGVAPNAFSISGDSNPKLSNSVVDSNCWDSLIDLKLGRFGDHGDAIDVAFSKGATILSSSESSTPTKRVRASGVNSQTVYCQVFGCNKDLSSCKDYHKRHKVCEVHSKTAIVIVNGIEQRFCQQCSRFHLLAEFDDGKRSCRKRLAGHNERRRKPQVGIHSGKSGRLLQPCGDSMFNGIKLPPSSFMCPEVVPNGVMHSDKYGFRHLSYMPVTNGQPQSRSLFPSYNQKHFPFLHENGATSTAGSIFCENNSRYPHAIAAQNSGLRPLFQDTSSLASEEDFNVFHAASTIQGLSGISDSCALSLLSSESRNSSSQSSGIPFAIPSSHSHHYSMSQISEKIGISSRTSSSRMSDRFPSELNPSDGSCHLSPILISDNFEMEHGIFQDSGFVDVKDCLSCEDGATIDLLQLSSQLQRVEHQRQSLQVKKESDSSCTLRIT